MYTVCGTSLVVQWLRLCAPSAGTLGSIPGQGTRSHMLQLKEIVHLAIRPGAAKYINIKKKTKKIIKSRVLSLQTTVLLIPIKQRSN